MNDVQEHSDESTLGELKRLTWVLAKLDGCKSAGVRLVVGSDDGHEYGHPNNGIWVCHVDIGNSSIAGTMSTCLTEVRSRLRDRLGPGYF